ncbi:hypothetical protein BGZ76_004685 [Entomortierella beljakovae]|nr:hypothetical protein BGZ76_004685 [Entomortierella beljakovae]
MSKEVTYSTDSDVRIQVLTKLSVTKRNSIKNCTLPGTRFDITDNVQRQAFKDDWVRQMEYWLRRKFSSAENFETILQRVAAYVEAWSEDGNQGSVKRAREHFLESISGLTLVMQPRRPPLKDKVNAIKRPIVETTISNQVSGIDLEEVEDEDEEDEIDDEEEEDNDDVKDKNSAKAINPSVSRVNMLVTLLRLKNMNGTREVAQQ